MSNAGTNIQAMDTGVESDPAALGVDSVVGEAMKRWRRCSEWEANARERFIEDVKYAEGDSDNGYQWPAAVKRNRDVDKRPCLTMNIVRQHNKQITNDSLQNKASIKIRAVGNGASVDSANLYEAMVRQIEYRSNAQSAYKHGSKFQVQGGVGWWRVVTEYSAPDSFDQELKIKRILDPLAVYMDPDCQEEDCSDAKFAFVFDLVPKDQFNEMYPEYADVASLQPLSVGAGDDDWITKDYVRVAEYFRKVSEPDTLVSFLDPKDGLRKSLLKSKMPKEVWKALKALPTTKTRSTDREKIEWKLIVGEEVCDETEWLGKFIPLIRCLGEETIIEGILDRKGHTRSMKDAQRMFNYNAALALDTPIPTPFGWTTMGQLEVGSWVFDENGQPVQVKKALPVRENENCFKIKFSDGSEIVSDAGHIWKVEEKGKRRAAGVSWIEKTISTSELTPEKHFIVLGKALDLAQQKLAIDPYLLGTWLGDGDKNALRITCHADDVEEQAALLQELGYITNVAEHQGNAKTLYIHGVRAKFADAGLIGDKHIPFEYMRGSKKQRLALIQGLMDTDGCFHSPVNQCIFVNSDEIIAWQFMELLSSLGIKFTVDKTASVTKTFPSGGIYTSKRAFRIQFTADPDMPVFRLSRKRLAQTAPRSTHWRRTKRVGILSVEKVSSVPVRCITLDTPEHLFLAGRRMLPTHNSAQVEFVALQSKTPYIASAKAIEDYEAMWNTANQVNHSVLIYNHLDPDFPDKPVPPPARQQPPTGSPGFAEGMSDAFNHMMMVSGQWQNAMGMQGNERTGAALRERKHQSDTSVFNFQDSYEDALRYTGKLLIDLIPKVYDTRRMLKLYSEDGDEMDVEIDPSAPQALIEQQNEAGNVVARVLNPTIGAYEVEADVGAAYGTRRQETVDALTLVLTQAPALTGLVGDLLLRAMDFKEAREAAQRLKRMVPPQALGKGPSPQEQKLQQSLQASQMALAKALEELAKKDLKLVGKDQMRDIDVYDSHTKRVVALAKLLPTDPSVLQELLMELGNDTMSETLKPIVEANRRGLAEQAGGEPEGDRKDVGGEAAAPVAGARQAPDGEWYLADPSRVGKYLRVGGLARQKNPYAGESGV